jgi:ribosomal protein S18 acetylase RimI-like enzyme
VILGAVVAVRPASSDDLAACALLIADHDGGAVSDWLTRFEAAVADPEQCLLVAVLDDAVAGYGRVQRLAGNPVRAEPPLPDGWYLSGIVVSEAHRRTGLGLKLCEARVAWVAERAADVWFFINIRNANSRALHGRAGFSESFQFSSPQLDGGEGVLGHRPARGIPLGKVALPT